MNVQCTTVCLTTAQVFRPTKRESHCFFYRVSVRTQMVKNRATSEVYSTTLTTILPNGESLLIERSSKVFFVNGLAGTHVYGPFDALTNTNNGSLIACI